MELFETDFWKVELSPEQYYLGRCAVSLKRECGELSGLTDEEILDLLKIVKDLEARMKKVFGATMFNWTCLMNDAWKETNDRKPRVHFHVRPRYKDKVEFEGVVFEDENFAHHYDRKIEKDISDEVFEKIAEALK
jgi:diadenosine tetraphosphate (Ap4A) HIT family hydrolase